VALIPPRIFVVATLRIRPGQLSQFEAYERQALAIASRHGGQLEQSIRSTSLAEGENVEVHVLTFPSEAMFAAYRADPVLVSLSALREAAISSTDILVGVEAPAYAT
jgi:uncharacterized protein (DUF1330 family)